MLIDIFKNSIFKTQVKNKNHTDYFKKILAKEMKVNKGRILSNKGGYQTNDITYYQSADFNNVDDSKVYEDVFIKPAIEFIKTLNCIKQNIDLSLSNYWINLNSKNDYNQLHNHPNSHISGVYYIEAHKNSGNIVFQNHNLLASGFNNSNIFFNNPNFWTHYTIIPETYDLILFPSELLHFVTPNNTNKKRISMAFNLILK